MKRFHWTSLGIALVWLTSASAAQAQGTIITIAHVNDTHSWLDAYGPKGRDLQPHFGGIARAATVIETIRANSPNVIVLHAGDLMHGTEFFNAYYGVPEFELLSQLGFDAMTPGNHEFDFGPDVLTMVLSEAGPSFPLLGANFDTSGYPALDNWIQPSIIKEVGGVKVGIFGMTTPDDPIYKPYPVQILGQGDPATLISIANDEVTELETMGANVVVMLSHLGAQEDKLLGANVSGLDVIIGGHTHSPTLEPVLLPRSDGGQTIYVRAGAHYSAVGKLSLMVDQGSVTLQSFERIELDRSVPQDPAVQAVVDFLKQGTEALYGNLYGEALAFAPREITTETSADSARRDSGLGNLVTDAYRAATGTQIAMTPDGLIDGPIPRGYVTPADVFRTVSYFDPTTGNDGLRLATFDITGADLVNGLEKELALGGDFFLEVSGLSFRYDSSAQFGHKIDRSSILIDGQPWDEQGVYSMTVNEASANLLPLLGVTPINLQVLPDIEYDVLRTYVSDQPFLQSAPEGRIRDTGLE